MTWKQRRLLERLAGLRAKKDYLHRMMIDVKEFPSYYADRVSDITFEIAVLEERLKIQYGVPSPEPVANDSPKDRRNPKSPNESSVGVTEGEE